MHLATTHLRLLCFKNVRIVLISYKTNLSNVFWMIFLAENEKGFHKYGRYI